MTGQAGAASSGERDGGVVGVVADERVAGLDDVLASLPVSFRAAGVGDAGTVHVVDGRSSWPERAQGATRRGARAVVVVEPGPAAVGAVDDLAAHVAAEGVPVLLAEGSAADPALAAAVREWSQAIGSADLLEVDVRTGGERPGPDVLLRAARLLRAAGRPVPASAWSSATLTVGRGGYAVVAGDGRTTLTLLAAASPETRISLWASGEHDQVQVELTPPTSAAPGTARRVHPTGDEHLDAVYESGHRALWRRLADELAGRVPPADHVAVLTAFTEDLRATQDLRGRLSPR